jgi:hypothetical protein
MTQKLREEANEKKSVVQTFNFLKEKYKSDTARYKTEIALLKKEVISLKKNKGQ